MPRKAKYKSLMVEAWEMHQRKKKGFQGLEKAVHIAGREKNRVKGPERSWGKLSILMSKPEQLPRPAVWPAASTSASWWGVSK